MKKKFFKNLFEKENNLQMYSINEFNVFRDIISFSKIEVYKEIKLILNDIDKNIDRQMAETVEKYHIVMSLKAQTEEISSHLTGAEEEIDVVIRDSKEANIIARYSEKMLYKLLEIGFASSDRELEKKAMTVTYSKRIMMKLDNIAKKDPAFLEEYYKDDIAECREEGEFKDMEEAEEVKFERFNDNDHSNIEHSSMESSDVENSHIETTDIEEANMEEIKEDLEEIIDEIEGSCGAADNADDSDDVEFAGELKINIYGEDDDSVSDKNNTSGVDEGGIDMIDEKYSKEAYDLFVKGDDHEVAEEKKNLGEEEYDVIIRESTDMTLRDNKDKEKVGEEAYEELIKGRKIKEVEEDEY
ncbi:MULTISPECIES: hypothetical protein [Peptacetobacter]|uniref:hypothetical protein n=1 Tax=Peptacetobacter TaxID=2743582 RepID=UPI002E790377|nr:hypothetical protein [Peptacetobacter hiranonis]MEE0248372.1 hypothetical protein [Peptacetobacter hiranonis]